MVQLSYHLSRLMLYSVRENMNLKEQIENFIPLNEQEEKDKSFMLACLSMPDVFTRENRVCHFTTSAWVVNKERSKVLFAYHNIYDSWAWLGGHADGEENLISVAIREAKEESGIKNVSPVGDGIMSLEVLTVDGHIKRGEYVSSHLHLNVTYLLEADEAEVLFVNEEENSAVSWIPLDKIKSESNEKWFVDNIYSKLIDRTR